MAFSISDVLTIIQNGVTAVNNLNIQMRGSLTAILSRFTGYESAWTAYTPTLTALAGVYTTASATGRYKTIGKTVFISVDIGITTFGTGTFPVITLPITPFDIRDVMLNGWENALVGFVVQARSVGDGIHLYVATVNNGDPVAGTNGRVFSVSGLYEAA